jgi:hypothetical protein
MIRVSPCHIQICLYQFLDCCKSITELYEFSYFQQVLGLYIYSMSHTCDRGAMLQLEICKFLAGDLVS